MLPQSPFMAASRTGAALVITLTGELDITIRAALTEQLTLVLEQQPAQLVYDLARVSYIDAGTANVLMEAARRTPCKPVLMRPVPIVDRLLRIIGLDGEFTIVQTATRIAHGPLLPGDNGSGTAA